LIRLNIMISTAHYAGSFDVGIKSGGTDTRRNDFLDTVDVALYYIHSQYNEDTYENDIMLIEVARCVNTTISLV
jgi:Trypsin